MPLPWKDNKPGWQQRLEADLDAIGLREAERRLATDFYDREYRETIESWIKRKRGGLKLVPRRARAGRLRPPSLKDLISAKDFAESTPLMNGAASAALTALSSQCTSR